MINVVKTISVWFILITAIQTSIAQSDIGNNKSSIISSLTKATFKITKNTDEKIIAEFPDPKMYYEYYFRNDICFRYEGLIPESEREYYISEMKRNGWIQSSIEDNALIYKKGQFVLKIITLTQGIGYFKFKIDKF